MMGQIKQIGTNAMGYPLFQTERLEMITEKQPIIESVTENTPRNRRLAMLYEIRSHKCPLKRFSGLG
jgi:hypothetical protein